MDTDMNTETQEERRQQLMFRFPVMPLCTQQLKDIDPQDIIYSDIVNTASSFVRKPIFRVCKTYKAGGGYDKFAQIYIDRCFRDAMPSRNLLYYQITGKTRLYTDSDLQEMVYIQNILNTQFVVQLQGCPLHCPYCYVTTAGIQPKNEAMLFNTEELVNAYLRLKTNSMHSVHCGVFHLMGGAPALYLPYWRHIGNKIQSTQYAVFHSDFLLCESLYEVRHLQKLPGLHAVSFKEDQIYTQAQRDLLFKNLQALVDNNVNFYITFTGEPHYYDKIRKHFGSDADYILRDSFEIPIRHYKALED